MSSSPAETASSRPNGTPKPKRFELPVLVPLGSLTAGTNIPPPPDSPVEKTIPTIYTSATEAAPSTDRNDTNVARGTESSNYGGDSGGRINGDTSECVSPTSPISPKRPGSIRRFLSHRSLRSKYSNPSQENLGTFSPGSLRPDTSGSVTTVSGTPKAAKRSSSWFGRFTSPPLTESKQGNKRTSIVYEEKLVVKSPPPKLPELSQLHTKIEVGMGAEDMFKNIK